MTLTSSLRRYGATLLLAFATACSGGGGDNVGAASTGSGNVSIVLSDATSETLSAFEVDVRGIVFQRRNGGAVAIAPRTNRIDFVQMSGLSDLIATTSLPAGRYDRVTMTLDFATARVVIAGQSTPATVRDPRGTLLDGPVDVQVDFAGDDRLVVVRGRRHLFAFDLDLDQSVAVDGTANLVTFTPVLNLDIDPTAGRPIGTVGVLRSVDTNTSLCQFARLADDGSVQNEFTVATTATTVFQVDGVPMEGALGLGSLVSQIGKRIVVRGELNRADARIDARSIEAGYGVIGSGQDVVFGHVVARTVGAGGASSLTVRGRSIDFDTSVRRYDVQHTVNVSLAFTKVVREDSLASVDCDDVNVGQQVWVFGELAGTTMNATTFDAVVRMEPTRIRCEAAAAPANNVLTVEVQSIGQLEASRFNFTVAGQSEADPAAFRLDVTGLQTAGIGADTRLEVLAWFSAVGSTGPDATALQLASRTSGRQLLFCEWSPSRVGAVLGTTVGALTLDLVGSPVHFVRDRSGPTVLTATPAPQLVGATGSGHFRIIQDHGVATFSDFATFRAEVLARTATGAVHAVTGRGSFDAPSQTLTASDATVVLR